LSDSFNFRANCVCDNKNKLPVNNIDVLGKRSGRKFLALFGEEAENPRQLVTYGRNVVIKKLQPFKRVKLIYKHNNTQEKRHRTSIGEHDFAKFMSCNEPSAGNINKLS